MRSLLLFTLLVGLAATAPTQSRLADINRTTPTDKPSSGPTQIASLGSIAILAAADAVHGRELWGTDGTASGTSLLRDIQPGSRTSHLFLGSSSAPVWKGAAYFWADDGVAGAELWRSDGTTAGTVLVKDVNPGPAAGLPFLAAAIVQSGKHVYFSANDGTHGLELWRTDGTPAGTVLVKDIAPGMASSAPRELYDHNGVLYFQTAIPTPLDRQVWKSDGTTAGTVLLRDFGRGSIFALLGSFTSIGPMILFAGQDAGTGLELWRSDGTSAGTTRVTDIRPGAGNGLDPFGSLVAVGATAYFSANEGSSGSELWRSDGTADGTVRVADIHPGSRGSLPTGLLDFGGVLLFSANDGTTGAELWRSDGTNSGTVQVLDVRKGPSSSSIGELTSLGSVALFRARTGLGSELWRTDGTGAGTAMVSDIMPGTAGSKPVSLMRHANTVLFAADDGKNGVELWRSDGTTAGTTLVTDIHTPAGASSSPSGWTDLDGAVVFAADDGVHGRELWRSDGTGGGTALLADALPGIFGSKPTKPLRRGDELVFGAFVSGGAALMRTDGTPTGTRRIKMIRSSSLPLGNVPVALAVIDDVLFFSADDGKTGVELWRTDGTAAGTRLVRDIFATGSSLPRNAVVFGGQLLFTCDGGPATGVELWRSDGTADGTVIVKDVNPSLFPFPGPLVVMGNAVYFAHTDTHGEELWRTDGTAAGTVLVRDIRPGGTASSPRDLVAMNGVLVFSADDGLTGRELWRSDGTASGTRMVADLEPGKSGGSPTKLTYTGNQVLFAARDTAAGSELWRSDGTAAGTQRVLDIAPGPRSASPRDLRRVGSGPHVVFAADDWQFGSEVWVSDGTAAGTRRLSDIGPGPFDGTPRSFFRAGTTVLFTAHTHASGTELYSMPLAATGASLAEPLGRGCPGSSGVAPVLGTLGLPVLGNATFGFALNRARPSTLTALHLSPNSAVLVLDSCTVYLGQPYTILFNLTDGAGHTRWMTPIPANAGFGGLAFLGQVSVLDPGNSRPITLSNAVRLLVGR